LHVIAIRASTRFESLRIASRALLLGIDPLERGEEVESQVLQDVELNYSDKKRHLTVALDGELVSISAPLAYSYSPQALRIVVPPA